MNKIYWMTMNEEEFARAEFYLNNLVEDWQNPEEDEYRIVNPHEAFLIMMQELKIPIYGPN